MWFLHIISTGYVKFRKKKVTNFDDVLRHRVYVIMTWLILIPRFFWFEVSCRSIRGLYRDIASVFPVFFVLKFCVATQGGLCWDTTWNFQLFTLRSVFRNKRICMSRHGLKVLKNCLFKLCQTPRVMPNHPLQTLSLPETLLLL